MGGIIIPFSDIREPEQMSVTEPPSEFVNDADVLRWRAWWNKHYDGSVLGIKLECYPVVRPTPCGAWIDPHAYREWRDGGMKWSEPHKELLKWVGNASGAAWAKPTKEAALDSLFYRYKRWSSRILNDIEYFMNAGKAMTELFPERAILADQAHAALLLMATNGKRN